MVIKKLAVVPGKSGSDAVTVPVPVPLVAINTAVKLPEALVKVARGIIVPREGLLTEKLTTIPAGAGFPFTNT
ncbi:hypothetical protein [Bacillus cereus]|uniref:hypothetical protein n=1 Tax=Bacillus cereus TaxID=1396 RepID=UPI0039817D21